ncbi:MAG: glycosyltransferase family 39 protein [Sediminicola sp.]
MENRDHKKVVVLAVLACISIVAISFMKDALELEDAEQAYYSQWWRWGYDDQPPLYTWIQIVFNSIFGVSRLSLSLVRGLVFGGTLLSLYRLAFSYLGQGRAVFLVVASLSLVPLFIDFTFRRLSHTSLMCLVVVLTYLMLWKLLRSRSLQNYVLLGLIIGAGLLTKYNYVLVLVAVMVAMPFHRGIQKMLWHRYMFVTVALVVLCIAPHMIWLWTNESNWAHLGSNIQLKTGINGTSLPLLGPLATLVLALLKLFGPLALFVALAVYFKKVRLHISGRDWLTALVLAQLVVITLFVLVLDMSIVERRWLFPLLLPGVTVPVGKLALDSSRLWERLGFGFFITVLGFQLIRTPLEKSLKIPSSVHYGFGPISEKLLREYPDKQWQLPNVTYGGNVRLLSPGREIISLDDYSLPQKYVEMADTVTVVEKSNWIDLSRSGLSMPQDSLVGFGMDSITLYFIR